MRIRNKQAATVYAGTISEIITSQLGKLLLVFDFSTAKPASMQTVFDLLKNIKVNLDINTDGRSSRVYRAIPLSAIVEYDAANEGTIYVQQDSANTIGKVIACIPISNEGSYDLDADGQYRLDITGLPTTAGLDLSLYGFNSPIQSNTHIEASVHTCQADSPDTTVKLDAYETALIPINDVESVRITYSNGQTQELYRDELLAVQAGTNDVLAIGQTGAHPAMAMASTYQHAVLDIVAAREIVVTKAVGTAATLHLFRTVVNGNGRAASSKNASLTSTI